MIERQPMGVELTCLQAAGECRLDQRLRGINADQLGTGPAECLSQSAVAAAQVEDALAGTRG